MARKPTTKKSKDAKVEKVLSEFKAGELHSGSKKGPVVRSKKQAVAIALAQSGQSKRQHRGRRRAR